MFKTINKDLMEGPCPYCKSVSFKFKENETWMFLCHSCQRYFPFSKIKDKVEEEHNEFNYNSLSKLLTPVSDLPDDHKCKKYCSKRQIPYETVRYISQFNKFSDYSDVYLREEERLVLPFLDENGDLFGLQGRALDSDSLRYITVMFNKDRPKVFGLDRVDMTKDYVVVEGPIDSLFVDNCIAMAGSDGSCMNHNGILCLDNEPRSKVIIEKMKKNLNEGYRVVIWPENIKEKDINDMYLAGYDVNTVIRENIYKGLDGLIKLGQWKKV